MAEVEVVKLDGVGVPVVITRHEGGVLILHLWAEIQSANMRKFPGGKVLRREDGKVIKPEGWTPPDIESAVKRDTLCAWASYPKEK